jgi:hypothetical protein
LGRPHGRCPDGAAIGGLIVHAKNHTLHGPARLGSPGLTSRAIADGIIANLNVGLSGLTGGHGFADEERPLGFLSPHRIRIRG